MEFFTKISDMKRYVRGAKKEGKKMFPPDELFLKALEEGLPPCAGVAFGFDRIVMLVTGAESIEQVIPFPFERA